jgi:hypothetical protein
MHRKIRKRIIIGLIFIITLFILVVNLPAFLVITRLDHQIKNYIVQKMITGGSTVLNVSDINIGFKRIVLKNVDFISKTRQITTVVRGIEFDYNIFTLILNPDKPYKAINEIYFTEPQLVLHEQGSESEMDSTDTRLSSVLETLRQINFTRVMIEEGRISFKHTNGEFISLVSDLQGWVESTASSNLQVLLSGKLARSYKDNFKLNFMISPKKQTVEGEVSLINYQLNLLNDLYHDSSFVISNGVLNSELNFKLDHFSLNTLSLYGSVSVKDAESKIYKNQLSEFAFNASIFARTVLIENASGTLDASPFSVDANIADLFHPVLKGKFLFPGLHLSVLEDYLKTGNFNGSKVRVSGDFKFSENDYFVDLDLSSPEFWYNQQVVHDFSAQLVVKPDRITVNSAVLNYLGFSLRSEADINLDGGEYTCSISGSRQFNEHLFFDKISFADQVGYLDVHGNINEKTLDGQWHYYIDDSRDTLLSVEGGIHLINDIFNFFTYNKSDDDLFLSLQISDIFRSPKINFGYLKNPPLEQLTGREWIHDLLIKYKIESILNGSFNAINTELRLLHRQSSDQNMVITASIDDLLQPEKKIRSKINIMHLEADCDLLLGPDYLIGRLISGEFLRGDIDINLHRQPQLLSKITVEHLKLNQVLKDNNFGDDGEINGDIAITGLLDAPEMAANLVGDKLILNEVGYYKVLMDIKSDTDHIYVEPMRVSLNNYPVLDGTLGVNIKKKQISLTAKGEGVAAGYFFKSLTGKEMALSGNVAYNLVVNGPITAPKSELELSMLNGELAHNPYELIEISLIDSVSADSTYFKLKNHVLIIKNLKAINSGQYHFEGSGIIPLSANGPIDFEFRFDGDLFSFLPQWHNFFVDGGSFTSIKCSIAGTSRNPRISKWQADIERGELWLKDVAEHVENIHGRIILEEGSNRISFNDLYGEIDGRKVSFQTVRNVTASDGRKLEHWYFKNLDLDFGILAIKTLNEGIELRIPGLMEQKETCILQISGREPEESFYFAGPVKHPCAWGQVIISDSRITFPFITGSDSKPSKTVEFLKTIDWDVLALAGKDLEYIRDIPALIGYVDTEVSVDPASEGLYFKGILANNGFGIEGRVYSTRGRLDYLDMNFRVENFGVEFNKLEIEPEVYGRAWTTVRDSVGAVPRTIYLDLYAYNEETNQENDRARWEDFKFRLSSADVGIGETQDEVLAYLGYTEANIEDKAKDVGGAVTENYFIRPLLRPVERSLERFLGMDMVRFNSALAKNLFYTGFSTKTGQTEIENQKLTSPYLYLMESSELTVGKYLSRDLYLTYTGQLVLNSIEQQNELNFNHSVGLEYRFLNNLLIELEYGREFFNYYHMYSNKLYQDDFKIRLRHSFTF